MNTGVLRIEIMSLALVTLGLGCNGGSGTTTQSDFCAQKADRECAGVHNLCVSSTTACQALRISACNAFAAEQQAMPNAIARPFRPDKVADCLSKTSTVYAKSTITPADRLPMDVACARVFSGKKTTTDTDKSCTNDYECDGDLVCDPDFLQCATKNMVAANAGCNNPGEVCPTDQYCVGSPRACTPKGAMGVMCDATHPCVETLRCAVTGLCVSRVDVGGACTSDDDCAVASPYCDTYNGSICTTGFTPSIGTRECVVAYAGATPGGSGGTSGAGGVGGIVGGGGAGGF
jgi:hypothetical protein